MFARLRMMLLFYLLLLVAGTTWLTRDRLASWEDTLWVAVHPINGDNSLASRAHIAGLSANSFGKLDTFFAEQARDHGLPLRRPVKLILGETVAESPPLPPSSPSVPEIMLWSLKLRWWAWRVDKGPSPPPADVQLFVRYFDPETEPVLHHSLGIQEGHIGVVNAFASRRASGGNRVVMAHELLHTLGAQDRYDPSTNLPVWPEGFAAPEQNPRYPQSRAELMGGRIPIDQTTAEIPRSSDQVVIGPLTAQEIGWRSL